jgi:hypothetical protein
MFKNDIVSRTIGPECQQIKEWTMATKKATKKTAKKATKSGCGTKSKGSCKKK